jgi:flavin reductase (DIM6/NTAB) family NADH-FMN oxidoreductase RutF
MTSNADRAFRNAVGRFATGVTIITAAAQDGQPVGMTMNSFSSVSLDPPLIQFSVGKTAFGIEVYRTAKGLAVNILGQDQEALSNRFARPSVDKWDGVRYAPGYEGAPLIERTLARIECAPWAIYEGGDHLIFVCRVVRFSQHADRPPLLFYGGRYVGLAADPAPPGEPA